MDLTEEIDSQTQTTKEDTHFQILQENPKVKIIGGLCSVYKSTKNNFCGQYSHQTSITSLDLTHVIVMLDTKICKK